MTHDDCNRVDRETLDCWRQNYGLDKAPHELHAYWSAGAPPGAVLALKAAAAEIERLRAELKSEHDDRMQTLADAAGLMEEAALWEERARHLGWGKPAIPD